VPVMFEDGFDVSEEVQSDVLRPEDINGLFNSFKYSKGASILFMLESTVGPDNFQAGLIVTLIKKFILIFVTNFITN